MTTSSSPLRFKSHIVNQVQFLSNFWPYVRDGPVVPADATLLVVDGVSYRSVEHAYQTLRYDAFDPYYGKRVYVASTAELAKRLAGKGQYVSWRHQQLNSRHGSKASLGRDYDRAREKWNVHSVKVMKRLLTAKFTQNADLRARLLSTGVRTLSEIGRFKKDWWCHTGEDMLGKLLMEVRAELTLKLGLESEGDDVDDVEVVSVKRVRVQ